jgi:periplasmic protein TonB
MKIITIIFCIIINCSAQQDSVIQFEHEEPMVQVFPDEPAELIGGLDSLQVRLIYPVEATEKNIQGTCYVLINVDTMGIPSKPFLVKGIGHGCDEEAIRLVINSKYLPAFKKGKAINSQTVVKVIFKLPED